MSEHHLPEPQLDTENSWQNKDADFSEYYPLLASRFKRWIASLINIWVFYLLIFVSAMANDNIVVYIMIVLYFCLELYMMYRYRQTLGKYCLKIKVVDYRSSQPLSFSKYVIREVLDFVWNLLGLPILISVIMVFVNKERRSLTDMIMSTIVIKTN